MRPVRPDPAPSRAAYRLHRFRLSAAFRRLVILGPPAAALALAGGWIAADPGRLADLRARLDAAGRWVAERPAFMLDGLTITGVSPDLADRVRAVAAPDFPVSSFVVGLEALRARVLDLDVVAQATVRVRSGRLEVAVTQRQPAVVWRTRDGLSLLDAEGERVATIAARDARGDLPLVAGQGADARIGEALALFTAAAPIAGRLRGLVRMGERRWDVVLDRGQRILLPPSDPVAALRRVAALEETRHLLARDLVAVDMRRPDRPTLRLGTAAVERRRWARSPEGDANG